MCINGMEMAFPLPAAAKSWNGVGSVPFHPLLMDSAVGAHGETQPIADGQPRGNWIIVLGASLTPYRSHLKMRFLKKKFWERSPKEKKPENAQDNRATTIDAKRDRNAEGEYRLRRVSELARQMGLIRPSH